MVDANFGATQPAKETLGLIGAGFAVRIGLRVVDPLRFKPRVQLVPMGRFVGGVDDLLGAANAR